MQCVCTALEVENFDFTRKTVFEFHAKFHHLDQRVVPETSKSHFSKPCRVEIGRRVEGGIRQSSPSCLLIYGVCCSLYSTLDLVYVLWRKGQKNNLLYNTWISSVCSSLAPEKQTARFIGISKTDVRQYWDLVPFQTRK